MPSSPRTDDDSTVATETGKSSITRRRALQTIAAGAVATFGTLQPATADESDEYERITVDAGEHRTITVDDGEAFENVLIDVTADGSHVTIAAQGTDWTIRNVGIEGRVSGKNAVFGVADTGGNTSTIENVYLGDGAIDGHRIGLGIWVAPEHSGHIDVERVNIQEMGDNSFYCSAPGGAGGGTVDIRNCYSANSWVSHFRLADGVVENCTAVNDERHQDGRGVWAWAPGTVEVVDCDLLMNGRHYAIEAGANGNGTAVEVSKTAFTTDFHGGTNEVDGSSIDIVDEPDREPADELPEGCPDSATEAAEGTD
ncbi:hypothetical protein [Halovivax gelatinilyticus]|uniref:hypothetical protein n=1 Tax=Halovivax gelatinilyticus TaxID=2961597 RepID=UPI0020CA8CA3|nr:hypothetical protein [Halovivax gelatinilyticus]